MSVKHRYLWLLLAISLPAYANECPDAPFRSSFLQPLASDLERPAQEWQAKLAGIAATGIETLYLQWSVYGDLDLSQDTGIGFLTGWLDQAHSSGLSVHLGLVADADFGTRITEPADALSAYLSDLRARSLAVAGRLDARIGGHPAFAGWYLPEEIDDRSWADAWQVDMLREHLRAQVETLARLSPAKTVSISTYVSGARSADQFEDLWRALWAAAPHLHLLLQDGAGVGALPRAEFNEYAQGINQIAAGQDRYWGMIVELFSQESGPPLDDAPFSATAAPIERVRQQLDAVAALTPGPDETIAFSVPEYLLDPTRPGQDELLSAYRRLYCRL
ncbi:hypothetical protein RE428_12760 [Marinobacter nanhaiticus D15-8W]|uniref:DUF4434 domain-containing protein n=1 Tax=Marinobacter nanhaiticus D15-8W TaxID=626887 RepID=N6WPB7_9GAMM|nr:DUF4434 domain-containing protein [Marinobacter nanhaiticus]ENO12907.1 DUF4434 domain-containing protein [Marinobacter nanhaiticus D15-8W]BES70258.1 hypothetical protein RE428_12760 [Marinobacter nanhaiticus D15-8W]